ncbi:DUF1292 domain-containing protein [Paenibacillus sp. YPG26]|uniref:DUF1292 domain-containing protein n=1 Tax=Paenibacillus sp. YPG26 TaxID=2878915 RepID=UPI00203E48B1|nr:DUF1292 domain-containing protein [Paenibacillus sp. YPG26]USB34317.1 DUF1292 domain-containing protein [Paenibacillus sp. YPG26]
MTEFSAEHVTWSSRVKEAFGPVVELQDEQGHTSYYRVEREFDIGGQAYVVLLPDEDGKSAEPEILKIITSQEGNLELVTIDDDDEWENVSELYDELTFPE